MSVTSSIVTTLKADGTLAGLLAQFDGEAAVFGVRPVPDPAARPYVLTSAPLSDEPADSKNGADLREVHQVIEAWADAAGSRVTLDAIGKRVRDLLHRQPWLVDGVAAILSEVSGGDELNGGPDVYGLGLTVRVVHEAQ